MGATRGDPIRILHVDDEPGFAEMAADFLEAEDDQFAVETATDAEQGLDRLAEADVDCVVSDYDMPGRDGLEFLEAVREDHPDLPFVLFTGKGSEAVASDAVSAGVTDYLQKESGTDQYTVLANRIRNAVERRAAERERERHLEAIETAQEGISILDEDGRYVYVNRAFADLHGYEPGEMIGERWELAYPEADVPEVEEEILPAVEREGYWHGETTSRRADGSTVEVDHTLARTDRGELICTVRDISGRKEREEALRRTTARLEALFENSPDMINVHDTDGNLVDPNPRLCQKTGYDAAELAGMKVWELDRTIDPEEAHSLWEGMDVGDTRRVDGAYRRRDGSTFPVEVHVGRFRLEGEDRFVAIARDVSEREERRAELERYERFDELADAVSHDLQTPLETARGRAELAVETGDPDQMRKALEAVERADELREDLVEVIRTREVVGGTEPVDVGRVGRETWRTVGKPDDASLRVEDPPVVACDPDGLRRLFGNLLTNAVEHGPEDVTVRIGGTDRGFFVEDDGPGIPPDDRDEVFAPGYSTERDGSGVGLASVEQIVAAHDWTIEVTDGRDGGARFEITGVETADG